MIRIKTKVLKPIILVLNSVAEEQAFQIGNDGIHFKMKDGMLDISSESREMNILFTNVTFDDDPYIVENTEFLVNAKKLYHIISTTSSEFLEFETEGSNPSGGQGKIHIYSNGKATLPLYDCGIFNKLEFEHSSDDFSSWKINSERLIEYLEKLETFVIKGASDFNLSGICIEKIEEQGMIWMGRNNHRGIYLNAPFNIDKQIVFSSNIVSILKRLKVSSLETRIENNKIIFISDLEDYKLQITARLLDVEYPLREAMVALSKIEKKPFIEIKIDTVKMKELMSQMKGFIDNDKKRVNAVLDINNKLKLSAGDRMLGSIDSEIELDGVILDDVIANNISFSFNHEYLEMFLRAVATKKFSLKIPVDGNILLSTGNKFKHDKDTEWSFFMTLYMMEE